jgi:hypothetical protein
MATSSANSNQTFLGRAWRTWSDFWFRPGDPSTLGLMRVVAGVFVVYTHLAYSTDLQEFFGKNAWVDLNLANQMRREYPIFGPTTQWEEPPNNIYLPQDTGIRRAFLEWARELPLDRGQRAAALEYLTKLPVDPNGFHGLAFAENLVIHPRDGNLQGADFDAFVLAPPGERKQLLDDLVDPSPEAKKRKLIPEFLLELNPPGWQAMKPAELEAERRNVRQNVRQQIERLLATMPEDPKKVSRIFGHFGYQASVPLPQRNPNDPPTEFHRTLNYLRDHVKDTAADRKATMDYLDVWGVDPDRAYAHGKYTWSIWFHVTDPYAMAVIHSVFLVFMVMFALGLFTRVSSVVTWLAALCYIHRGYEVLFGMDTMMNICLIYLMIGPSGATFSLDRWLAKRRAQRVLSGEIKGDRAAAQAVLLGPAPSVAATFATRLLQIHFCFIYFASGASKLKGGSWWGGTAIWYTIANPEFSPVVFSPYRWGLTFLAEHRPLWEIAMSGGVIFTLLLEIGFPFLVWFPRLRPYMLVGAILLHTGIATFMGLTVFSIFMMVLLMSYIPPAVVRRWADSGGRLFEWPRAPARERELVSK